MPPYPLVGARHLLSYELRFSNGSVVAETMIKTNISCEGQCEL